MSNRGKRTRKGNYLAKGIRKHGNRWEVSLAVKGESFLTSFPLSATVETMQAWQRRQEHAALEKEKETPAADARGGGTLQTDVTTYLARVASMPTLEERTAHLDLWIAALGAGRDRSTITTTEIDQVLHRWKLTGKAGKALSATSVRHRRTALLHLFNTLDGKGAANPVRLAWRPKEPKPTARAISMATVQAILTALKVHTGYGTATRARIFVLATTGLPNKQVGQITRRDVAQAQTSGVLPVAGRDKGAGTASRALTVTPEILAALALFEAADAYGPYSGSSLWKMFRAACGAAGVLGNVRPYDLKHSLGTFLYRQSKDLASVARVLDVSLATARRYTLAAHAEVDQATMALAAGALTIPRPPEIRQNSAAESGKKSGKLTKRSA